MSHCCKTRGCFLSLLSLNTFPSFIYIFMITAMSLIKYFLSIHGLKSTNTSRCLFSLTNTFSHPDTHTLSLTYFLSLSLALTFSLSLLHLLSLSLSCTYFLSLSLALTFSLSLLHLLSLSLSFSLSHKKFSSHSRSAVYGTFSSSSSIPSFIDPLPRFTPSPSVFPDCCCLYNWWCYL
ncbi:unnamed protein product [Acanthosepion pharaonis]|uniref:Uncharacterized protein n=1 Tax=Acanthosepion pharaonis TaxID=158019 RepID=A0A812D059_ACAPH|nr:unnamed protein product [Sepia pharaonis]